MKPVQQHETFTFTGKGEEYFRIWIVNVCATLLTFGIYSAWAKVRRLQYFYRHTRIAGACCDHSVFNFTIPAIAGFALVLTEKPVGLL